MKSSVVKFPPQSPAPRVLIVLDTWATWARGTLRGFVDSARERQWTLLHYRPNVDIRWLVEVWQPHVVVLQPARHAEAARVLEQCAVVAVNDDQREHGTPSVYLDEDAIGKLAAEHLLSKGFRNLTTFRFDGAPFALAREQAFARVIADAGARLAPGWGAQPEHAVENPAVLGAWLRSLPRPCGIFAGTDSWARVVARYAQVLGTRIPEELSLVGADDDTVDGEFCLPPLSSVAIPWLEVGQSAARLVEQALPGGRRAKQHILVPPVGVIARRSTDAIAVEDPVVLQALQWILAQLDQPLSLNAIAKGVACSRQRLETRFRAALGRTVMQEVRRARVEHAKDLLLTTDLLLPAIAKSCGFSSAALLSEAFRRETGVPPGKYRRRLESSFLDGT